MRSKRTALAPMLAGAILLALVGLGGLPWASAESQGPLPKASICGICGLMLPVIASNGPATPVGGTIDLTVTSIEYTQDQSILGSSTSVPNLVANRPVLARVYVGVANSAAAVGNVTAQMHALRGGVELAGSPINPSNGPITAPLIPQKVNINDTVNFFLPASWLSASVDVYAVVNPGGTVGESNSANNRYPASGTTHLTFEAVQALTIKVTPIIATWGTTVLSPFGPPYDYIAPFAANTYPVPQVSLNVQPSVTYAGSNPPTASDWTNMLNLVTTLHLSDSSPYDEFFGLVSVPCQSGCIAGLAWVNFPCCTSGGSIGTTSAQYMSAVGFDGFPCGGTRCLADEVAAHEIAHTNGRYHAPNGTSACNASQIDPAYPNTTGYLDDWGYNIFSTPVTLFAPTFYRDVMSYCNPNWMSRYTYQGIYNFRGGTPVLASPNATPPEALALSGALLGEASKQLEMGPAWRLNAPLSPNELGGEYRVELRDESDGLLTARHFNMHLASASFTTPQPDVQIQAFSLVLPYDERVRQILVYRGEQVIASRRANPGLSLKVDGTPGDPARAAWTGAGARGYLVRVSNDGGKTWKVVGHNLTQTELTLDLAAIPGGTVVIEVQASDGVRAIVKRLTRQLAKHAPHAHIATVYPTQTAAGQPVLLRAKAYDAEDGTLEGEAVQWSSDRDGVLAKGATLWLAQGLDRGVHVITLAVTDADGNRATDQVRLEVQ